MQSSFKTTMIAVLLGGVALTAALPALAQETPPPAPDAMAAPDAGPMAGPMGGPMGRFDLKTFDRDGDGKVTLAEVQASRADKAKATDADGDGKLSADELIAADLARAKANIEARVKDRIATQDADGDGKLSAAELLLPPAPDRIFARFDADKDGAVTQAELDQGRAAMQARMQDRRGDRGPNDGGPNDRGSKCHAPRDHGGHGWFGWGQN